MYFPTFQSHGSLPVRVGAVIFGMGTVAYFTLEFVALVEFSSHPDCFSAVEAANVVAAIALVVLQTYLIFVFPRMNLRISPFIDRFVRCLYSTCSIRLSRNRLIRRGASN